MIPVLCPSNDIASEADPVTGKECEPEKCADVIMTRFFKCGVFITSVQVEERFAFPLKTVRGADRKSIGEIEPIRSGLRNAETAVVLKLYVDLRLPASKAL